MIILGTNSVKDTGYDVDNSLRFNDGSSDNLARTPSSASNQKTWTWSGWVKRASGLGTFQSFFGVNNGNLDSAAFELGFNASNQLTALPWNFFFLKTNAVYRDTSAWYHVVFAFDTTQSTSTNRFKLYVNGQQVTSFASTSYPSLNTDWVVNSTASHRLGIVNYVSAGGLTRQFDGYMAEVCLIDGQQLDPTSFGEFDEDSGIWKPIDVSGLTFGTNGFYQEYKQSGTGTNSSGMGADTSGNDNHFAVNNLTAIDQSTDTCTNNFATINSLDNYFYASTLSEGNLKQTCNSGNYSFNTSTFGVSQGKWYVEVKVSGSNMRNAVGIVDKVTTGTTNAIENLLNGWSYAQGEVYNNSSQVAVLGTPSSGNIVGIYLDLDNNKLYFAINGTIQNSGTGFSITASASTTNGNYFFAFGDNAASNSDVNEVNFGSPSFTISSGNTDANGYGNFEYNPSSGTFDGASKDFYALCTKNLAEYG